MIDKWVTEYKFNDETRFEIYDSLEDAMEDADEGDHIYKIPAESFQYLGAMTSQLVK